MAFRGTHNPKSTQRPKSKGVMPVLVEPKREGEGEKVGRGTLIWSRIFSFSAFYAFVAPLQRELPPTVFSFHARNINDRRGTFCSASLLPYLLSILFRFYGQFQLKIRHEVSGVIKVEDGL